MSRDTKEAYHNFRDAFTEYEKTIREDYEKQLSETEPGERVKLLTQLICWNGSAGMGGAYGFCNVADGIRQGVAIELMKLIAFNNAEFSKKKG